MHLDLKEISAGETIREYSVAADTFPELKTLVETEEVVFTSPLDFSLRMQKAGTLVELDGRVAFTIRERCGRCLSPFEGRINADFALTFTRQKESETEQEELELEAGDLGLIRYEDERIDLLQPLQEQVIINLPIGPLCRQDCRGLCSECGANLNDTECGCEKQSFNNKFAALKDLKIDRE